MTKLKYYIFFLFLILIAMSMQVSAVTTLSVNVNTTNSTNQTFISQNQITLSSFMLIVNTDEDSTCKYSTEKGQNYDSMSQTFELEYGKIHKKAINGLMDGLYKSYVRCKNVAGNVSQELEIIYTVNIPITAQISLENGENLKDGKTKITLITSKVPKTTPSLSYTVDGSTYIQVPLIGSEKIWNGYIIISPERESKVGSFKFQAKDLEDNIGTEITSGAIFTIDTIAPNGLLDVNAQGTSKGINLTWKTDEEDLTYNIYRSTSPGVSYSDLYKKVNKNIYHDTDVSAKTTYYYKVSGIDSSGNEGPLSNEIAGISTLSENAYLDGLDLRYVGLVESLIDKIDSVSSTITNINRNIDALNTEEKEIASYLKISSSINNAKTSLTSLKTEVESYKAQALSKNDLDKKLNSAEVRLNIIKSNLPESIRIKDEKSITNTLTDNDLNSNILEIKPNLDYEQLNKMSEKSSRYLESGEFKVSGKAYHIELSYLDNTQKIFTLIKKNIDFNPTQPAESLEIIEYIPKDVAESTKELNINNKDYTVVKEDPILSFSKETKDIVYFVKEEINLNYITNTKTFLIDNTEDKQTASITGFVTLQQVGDTISTKGILFSAFLIIGLGLYFVFIKIKKNNIKFEKIQNNLDEINKELDNGKISSAIRIYADISKIYRDLNSKNKKKVYPKLEAMHRKLISAKSKLNVGGIKSSFGIIIAFFSIFLLLFNTTIAIDENLMLKQGKNTVIIDQEIKTSELVKLNPEIQAITYYDSYSNESYAYINVFGGIGKDFTLEPNKEYEITSKKEIILKNKGW